MKFVAVGISATVAALTLAATPASAGPVDQEAVTTTLDACGYFVGVQTPREQQAGDGVTTQRGTWTGVYNNYVNTPVASLGPVQGAFVEVTQTIGADTYGTESFTSNAGKITQQFAYGPDIPGFFSVTVTATRDLAFLTSDTNGNCYTGPFPRP